MNMKTFKSVLALLMSLALVLSCAVLPAAALDTIGDVNGDGALDMMDAFRAFQFASVGTVPTEAELAEGDTDADGDIDMIDAFAIFRVASGGENNLPAKPAEPEEPVTYIDMLVLDNVDPGSTTNATVTAAENGSLLIEATEEGQVGIVGPGTYDAATLQYTHLSIESDVPFIIKFYDGANGKWMDSSGDFYPQFGLEDGGLPAAAGTYTLNLDTESCYTWDGSALPETVQMSSIYIYPQAAGKILVKHLALSASATCNEECEIHNDTLPKMPVEVEDRVMDGEYIAITGNASEAKAGDIVTVSFDIAENSYITNGEFNIFWDATKLEVQETNEDEDLLYMSYVNGGIFKSSWMKLGVPISDGQYNFGFAGASATSMMGATKGGTMFSMQFKVLEGWTGTEEIIMAIPELCSNDEVIDYTNGYNTNCDYYVTATVTVA